MRLEEENLLTKKEQDGLCPELSDCHFARSVQYVIDEKAS
jgi:hypothetical protein